MLIRLVVSYDCDSTNEHVLAISLPISCFKLNNLSDLVEEIHIKHGCSILMVSIGSRTTSLVDFLCFCFRFMDRAGSMVLAMMEVEQLNL